MEGWVNHFQGLATPKDDPSYDEEYLRHVEADVAIMESLADQAEEIDTITVSEVRTAVKKLNKRKAQTRQAYRQST